MAIVTSYKVIEAGEVDPLVKEVNAAIKVGWQPIGGIQVKVYGLHSSLTRYYQSMVGLKEEQNANSTKDS